MGIWKSIGRVVGYPLLHPQRTARGMGQALQATGKTTSRVVVGAGAGYVGWEKLTTDKSLTRIVGETVSTVTQLPGKAIDTLDGLTQSVDGASNQMSGIGNFIHNMSGGNFLDGIGNFFSNIGNGKVSGASLLGLVASAFMLFGRFGWFGKIAGALLGMMILGNNMGEPSPSQTTARSPRASARRSPASQTRAILPTGCTPATATHRTHYSPLKSNRHEIFKGNDTPLPKRLCHAL